MRPTRSDVRAPGISLLAVLWMSFLAVPVRGEPPAAWREDASLHSLQRLGKSNGWAVGDHGVALRTSDGGRTWEPRPVATEASLRAVWFVSDKVGWTAGGTTVPYTRLESGVIFRTDDGGMNWRQINTTPLPRICALRFFNPEDGIAAGAASPECPSGVLTTSDGGVTWKPIQAGVVVNPAGWRAAAFPEPGRAAVVGPQGRRSVVGEGQLIPPRNPTPGLRGLNAVLLVDSLVGWAVGDGGLILRTETGGLVWQDPSAQPPKEARELFDFQAVSAVGDEVWIAGRPGGVVWHSPDGGHSWSPQPTGTTLPIASLRFTGDKDGIAVGAMGLVLRTTDGGTTWERIRAGDRRASLLAATSRPERTPFPLLATFAGDQGYRAVVVCPVRHDIGPARTERPNLDLRLNDAVVAAGGGAAVTDWPLPLSIPGIDRQRDALVAEWNRRTEGDLQRVVVGRFAAAIRTWRPDVVVLEEPTPGDAAGELTSQAAQLAIDAAADSTRFLEHRQAGLGPWQVRKVYVRSAGGGSGDASIAGDEVLSRLGVTAADLSEFAAARLDAAAVSVKTGETYRLVPQGNGSPQAGPFFAGLAIAAGTAARRNVAELEDRPALDRLASRRRNLTNVVRPLEDPRRAAEILAQIDEVTAGLSPSQAARQLHFLAETHRVRSRWDLAEQTYLALVERYPQEPPARDGMTRLLRLWTGAEPVWRRLNDKGTVTERGVASVETLEARVETAFRLADQGVPALSPKQIEAAGLGPDPVLVTRAAGAVRVDVAERWDNATVDHWNRQAVKVGALIRRVDPALFSTPDVQFPLAKAVRNGGGSAAAYLQRFAPDPTVPGWQSAAAAELILARPGGSDQVKTAHCVRTIQPPHLDASFSDPCWQAAKEVSLASDDAAPLPEGGLVLLAYDAEFLYVAASLPRVPGLPPQTIDLAGRTHDEDLRSHDRFVLSLDVDRDYSTSYRFAVDHRGRTADDCWGDAAWNPKWYVATDGDDERWRIEAAIPFAELGPRPAASAETWAVSLGRVAPAFGVQGWPRPNDGEPRPESFGLMRFE